MRLTGEIKATATATKSGVKMVEDAGGGRRNEGECWASIARLPACTSIPTSQPANQPTNLPTNEPSTADREIFLSSGECYVLHVRVECERDRHFVAINSPAVRSSTPEHHRRHRSKSCGTLDRPRFLYSYNLLYLSFTVHTHTHPVFLLFIFLVLFLFYLIT